jgi:hypothetical protein
VRSKKVTILFEDGKSLIRGVVTDADINKGSAERVTIEKLDQLVQRNLCY